MNDEYTVGRLFFETAAKHPNVVAQRDVHRKPEVELTYAQLADQIRAFGTGLAKAGIGKDDKVAIFSDNRPRWLVADIALLSIGAVDVPRGSDTATPEFDYILNHSDAVAAIVQDRKLFDRLKSVEQTLQKLRLVILMDDSADAAPAPAGVTLRNFSDVLETGNDQAVFNELSKAVQPGDLATIVYTSGTTGTPKGVMLSHRNLTHQALHLHYAVDLVPGDIQLTILPTWHAYERAAEYFGIRQATTLYYSDKRFLRDDMRNAQPHMMPCVPRIWESVYEAIHDKLRKEPAKRQKLFHTLVGLSAKYVHARRTALNLEARRASPGAAERALAAAKTAALAPMHKLADTLIYKKLRAVTGGRMKAAISGGGSLAPYLDDFFEIVGVPIVNGYGLTETAPVLCVRPVSRNVRGTVGPPMPGTEFQIREESGAVLPQGKTGIIWARGPGIMMGYYKNPETSRKAISQDGWFNSGDLGYITSTGDLAITGRAKDTIVLVSGENVEPDPIENTARQSALVNQIIVVGQDQKTLGALIAPNIEPLALALGKPANTPIETLCADPAAAKAVKDDIAKLMTATGEFKAFEQITRIALISEPFSEANGLLTQTMKPKRNIIAERYKDAIARLFS